MPRSLRRPQPQNTCQALETHLGSCQNIGLEIDKFQPWDLQTQQDLHGADDSGWAMRVQITDKQHRSYWTSKGAKGAWMVDVAKKANRVWDNFPLIQAWHERRQALVTHSACRTKRLKTANRLVIGLGAQTTLETGLTLHARYGLPYIPGSAQKGLTRSAAIFDLARRWGIPWLDNTQLRLASKTPLGELERLLETPEDNLDTQLYSLQKLTAQYNPSAPIKIPADKKQLMADPLFLAVRSIFGWMGHVGEIIFYDAPPSDPPRLVVEIMNPHFPNYYSKDAPPGDNQEPIPVPFLAVDCDSEFAFAVGARTSAGNPYLDQALEWLELGLREYGIGGKTSSGLGIFGNPPPPLQPPNPFHSLTFTYIAPIHNDAAEKNGGEEDDDEP